jgi:hypothetical protein
MIRLFFTGLLIVAVTVSCYRPSQPQAFKDMKILEGTWHTTDGVQFSETWKVINDSLIEGIGYSIKDGDTGFTERLKIYRMGNYVLYAAKPGSSKEFVHFRLEEAGKGKWKFVNPVHDYPNIIEYTMRDKNKLIARTTNNNGNKVVEFKMEREPR